MKIIPNEFITWRLLAAWVSTQFMLKCGLYMFSNFAMYIYRVLASAKKINAIACYIQNEIFNEEVYVM